MKLDFDQFPDWVAKLFSEEVFGRYERELILYLVHEFGEFSEKQIASILFLSLFVKTGHVCLPLRSTPQQWAEQNELEQYSLPDSIGEVRPQDLLGHPAFGDENSLVPFIVSESRLYMKRFLNVEIRIAQRMLEMSQKELDDFDRKKVASWLNEQYMRQSAAEAGKKAPDWQLVAAVLALRKQLLIISGGPGTGKTTTLYKILDLFEHSLNKTLKVALAAPTGKAAHRMTETLRLRLAENRKEEAERGRGWKAVTLHRLLYNKRSNSPLPPQEDRTLPYDLVVIDEASMVDLQMMETLLQSLDDNTRLIILGDKNQLSSVEAGAVLGDICRKENHRLEPKTVEFLQKAGIRGRVESGQVSAVEDCIIYLEKNWRFGSGSGIAALSNKVVQGETESLSNQFENGNGDLQFYPFKWEKKELLSLLERFANRYKELNRVARENSEQWDQVLNREVWLNPLRKGRFGTINLNRMVESYLARKNITDPENGWYAGRPVLVTRNDYQIGVFNGDLGLVTGDRKSGLVVEFAGSGEEIKRIPVHRLRHFEPAWFMTVHKSQGSEFDRVNLLLPGSDTPILTRELIYTAITRSRECFMLHGDLDLFSESASRKTIRFSGLSERIFY